VPSKLVTLGGLHRSCPTRPFESGLVAEDRSAGGVRDQTRPEPTPNAHGVAHETVRELARQGSTGRGTKTTKCLVRHTTVGRGTTRREGPVEVEGLVLDLPRALRALTNDAVVTGVGPHPPGQPGSRRHQVWASLFSPAVPPACHKQRTRAVSSGQPRSLPEGRSAGRTSLTCAAGGGRNCMACKGSGVQRTFDTDPQSQGTGTPKCRARTGRRHRLAS